MFLPVHEQVKMQYLGQILNENFVKNKKIPTSRVHQQNVNYTKKECNALKDGYFEFYVLCALRKNLIDAIKLAQQNNLLYSRNTIYARKRMKLLC